MQNEELIEIRKYMSIMDLDDNELDYELFDILMERALELEAEAEKEAING